MQHIAPDVLEEFVSPVMQPYFDKERERGREEGREEGRQQGREEGRQALAKAVLRIAEKRFHVVSPAARKRIAAAGEATLAAWCDRVLDAPTLDAALGLGSEADDSGDLIGVWIQLERQEALAVAVLQVAELRFAPVPARVRERIAGAVEEQLRIWLTQMFEAGSLSQIFGSGEGESEAPQAS